MVALALVHGPARTRRCTHSRLADGSAAGRAPAQVFTDRDDARTTTCSRRRTSSCTSASGSGRCATRLGFSRRVRRHSPLPPAVRRRMFHRRARAVRRDRGPRRSTRAGARADTGATCTGSSWSRCRARPTSSIVGVPYPRPVQRELGDEPDPGHLHRDWATTSTCTAGPAARAQGRRGDPLPPGAVGVRPAAPPVVRRLLRGGAGRDDRPGARSRRSSSSSTRRTRGTSTCTARATPTTACTRSTCGTGARTRWTTSAR